MDLLQLFQLVGTEVKLVLRLRTASERKFILVSVWLMCYAVSKIRHASLASCYRTIVFTLSHSSLLLNR